MYERFLIILQYSPNRHVIYYYQLRIVYKVTITEVVPSVCERRWSYVAFCLFG